MTITFKDYKYMNKHPLYKSVAVFFNLKDKNILAYSAILKNGTRSNSKFFDTARKAALCVDMFLINLHKQPVNILKSK